MEFFSLYLISSYIIYSIGENYMIDFNLSEHILSSLNQKELDLLKFIYLNSSAIARQTIQQFSNSVHVSSSSILRFCKKIGFSGFSELKYNIRTKSSNSSSCREKATSLENITKNILTEIYTYITLAVLLIPFWITSSDSYFFVGAIMFSKFIRQKPPTIFFQ